MGGRIATAVFLEFRPIPVLLWSFTAVSLGTAVAVAESGRFDPIVFLLSMAVATLIQGFETHAVNEIYDLQSGTDLDPTPRLLSGGSRVLTARLLSVRGMWFVFAVSTGLVAILTAALVALRGPAIAAFVAIGYVAGLVYTLPPIATSYRPFIGEWAGGFLGVFSGSLGAYFAQTGSISRLAIAAAGAHAFTCVGMLLVHHYLDREADAAARPAKRTTIVALEFPAGKVYTLVVAAAAIVLFGAAALSGEIAFLVAAIAAVVGLAAHAAIDPTDVASVTRGELRVIQAGIAGGVGTAILLAPVLWPLAPIAALGYVAHLRVGARFAAPRKADARSGGASSSLGGAAETELLPGTPP